MRKFHAFSHMTPMNWALGIRRKVTLCGRYDVITVEPPLLAKYGKAACATCLRKITPSEKERR